MVCLRKICINTQHKGDDDDNDDNDNNDDNKKKKIIIISNAPAVNLFQWLISFHIIVCIKHVFFKF